MSVATAVLGYYAAGPTTDFAIFGSLLLGTSLAAFGAAALNQWWERETDARMQRTADRPVASGRMAARTALTTGSALAVAGIGVLAYGTGFWPAALAAATILLYVLAYTPLKMKSTLATEVGAIPGALPPLIGWTAAGAGFSAMGWALFAVLFAWQIPHFMAISWNLRADYRRAGFRMLSISDSSGAAVAWRALLWSVLLVAVSFYPVLQPDIGWFLGVFATVLGAAMIGYSLQFLIGCQRNLAARRLFLVTLVYLPVYLGALVADRFFISIS